MKKVLMIISLLSSLAFADGYVYVCDEDMDNCKFVYVFDN